MNNLINVTDKTPIEILLQVGEDGKVSARNTHKFISPNSDNFTRWAKTNITENPFAKENADFTVSFTMKETVNNFNGGTIQTQLEDYRLDIPFAKKLCMLSKTERGEEAREYFIKAEQKLVDIANKLIKLSPSELIMKNSELINQLAVANVETERQLNALKTEVSEAKAEVSAVNIKLDTAINTFLTASPENWRGSMERQLKELCIAVSGTYPSPNLLGRIYADVEHAAGINLNQRLRNLQKRMRKHSGMKYSEAKGLGKMDVICRDKQLKAIFEGVLKKYQARYCLWNEPEQISLDEFAENAVHSVDTLAVKEGE